MPRPREQSESPDGQKVLGHLARALQEERMAVSRALEAQHERTLAEWGPWLTGTAQAPKLGPKIASGHLENAVSLNESLDRLNHSLVALNERLNELDNNLAVPAGKLQKLQPEEKAPDKIDQTQKPSQNQPQELPGVLRSLSRQNRSSGVLRNSARHTRAVPSKSSQPILRFAETLSTNPWYELFFGILIMANAVLLAGEAQYLGNVNAYSLRLPGASKPDMHTWPTLFEVMDWFFGLAFVFECCLAMVAQRGHWFCKTWWNWFDFAIVFSWVLQKLILGEEIIDPAIPRMFRLLRLLRMLRLVKTFQEFDVLRLIVASIKASTKVLLWSAVSFFCVLMGFSLMMQLIVEPHMMMDRPEEEKLILFTYFGTWSRSMLSMYELTLGNWVVISRHMCELVSPWFIPFAMIYNCIMAFAFVTVIRGIFLHETFQVAAMDDELMIMKRERQVNKNIEKMDKLFAEADETGDGILSKSEFLEVMKDHRVKSWLAAMELDIRDAELVFDLIDDGDGTISAPELVRGFAKLKGTARSVDMIYLTQLVYSTQDLLRTALVT
mmetsp:Transcript_18917/g.33336  ORF Transcript_18917/g.33336 Transcript_18917/m.33336 type:complete len:553 (+) Transcript_18917:42-1700(+)